jgi:hypothetical protein
VFIDIFRIRKLPLQVVENGGHQIFLQVEGWESG